MEGIVKDELVILTVCMGGYVDYMVFQSECLDLRYDQKRLSENCRKCKR